ncbi:M23 family metallopeptidase [Saccharothrix coeruleofusca]|uniref:M23ase beta-sheet core domain-containing protein n=1 Tax=Saccharothrix coeruleofusca TaxID=33919 RepID=A0A918AU41_9PSEU|nr:M23 family metallopeptidase [Saccharothrix coeruleofusca]MBP2337714.1 murein DD-endopeptidase MepM/ murein hydrolase activator NlpD [Saccharothrix coeruleofusca]GGP84632.1 hypothetical protein GCM10010185_68130 [Saccharothrix coeruleofusca]
MAEKSPLTGRVAAAVVAASALAGGVGVAQGAGTTGVPLAAGADFAAALAAESTSVPAGYQARTVHAIEPGLEAAKLLRTEALYARQHVDEAMRHAADGYAARQAEQKKQQEAEEARKAEEARVAAERAAAEEEAKKKEAEQVARPAEAPRTASRPTAVKPAQGQFTSGFGARWGTTHYGVDIANAIGTPILSVMDGVVVEAGPASGFGLWVRVQHDDGTITVYGHVDTITAARGQRVQAGEQIATMGNRGQSTGPHLHFEVWIGGSQKIDPIGWLNQRGISL